MQNINHQIHLQIGNIINWCHSTLDNKVDLNKRLDPFLHSVQSIRHQDLQRITQIALPFLNLYRPTSMACSVGLGSLQVWVISTQLIEDGRHHQWKSMGIHLVQIAFVVTNVALSILSPTVSVLFSSTIQISQLAYQFGFHLKEGHYREAALNLAAIAHQLIYLSSVIYAAPELLLASLLTQAAVELYRCYREWQRGEHVPESLSHLLMALLRLYQASSYAQIVHRDYFGNQITQKDVSLLVADIQTHKQEHPNQIVDFQKILTNHYYSSKIRNISFQKETKDLTQIFFNNVTFQKCDFSRIDLSGSIFNRVNAIKCDFSNTTLLSVFFNQFNANRCHFTEIASIWSIWNHCQFEDCEMEFAKMDRSHFKNTQFKMCNLKQTNFFQTDFQRTIFARSQMEDSNLAETSFQRVIFNANNLSYASFNSAKLNRTTINRSQLKEACFFDAQVQESQIKQSDLTDCLLLDTQHQFNLSGNASVRLTRPVIGLMWNFEAHGMYTDLINHALRDSGAITFRFDYRVKGINLKDLTQEVTNGLSKIAKDGLQEKRLSIGETLLKDHAGNELHSLNQKTLKVAQYIQGLLLPGGDDIEPEFYGQEGIPFILEDERSLFEFGMISQAIDKGLPVQGICRGSQIVNVFLGGTLHQNVEDHAAVIHSLQIKENCHPQAEKVIRQIIEGDSIKGVSMHHQACNQIGKGLNVVLEHENVPEALVSDNGKIILTQFHPESYLFEKNKEFLEPAKLEKFKVSEPFVYHLICQAEMKGKNFFNYLIQQAEKQKPLIA